MFLIHLWVQATKQLIPLIHVKKNYLLIVELGLITSLDGYLATKIMYLEYHTPES